MYSGQFIDIELLNGWRPVPGLVPAPQYRVSGDFVQIRGYAFGGASPVLGVLPYGVRPTADVMRRSSVASILVSGEIIAPGATAALGGAYHMSDDADWIKVDGRYGT